VVIGEPAGTHIGSHFQSAARVSGCGSRTGPRFDTCLHFKSSHRGLVVVESEPARFDACLHFESVRASLVFDLILHGLVFLFRLLVLVLIFLSGLLAFTGYLSGHNQRLQKM